MGKPSNEHDSGEASRAAVGSARADDVARMVAERGWCLLRRAGAMALLDVLEGLGQVIHVEEVVVAAGAGSLVKSDRALPLHTDHHRADFIVWHCLAQSDQGGETLLADAVDAWAALPDVQRTALTRVQLKEHSVFAGDEQRHPMVTTRPDGRVRVYYSYWLLEGGLDPEARAAFEAFACAVDGDRTFKLRLEPGDVLCIDNGRMLHGRTAIEGAKARHLRRYWIAAG